MTLVDRRLNLVVTIEGDAGTIHVHSMPISRAVFEKYFLVISKTFAVIYAQNLSVIAGPRIAGLLLRKTAEDMGALEDVDRGLIQEIRRLTSVIVLGEAGWETLPLGVALDRGLISADDYAEAEGAITFFILASAVHRRNQLASILSLACEYWGTQTTLLSVTEYRDSLSTSTQDASSGATAAESLVPG